MSHAIACSHCGGMMEPDPSGRLYSCKYCGTKQQVAIGAEQLAAGFALDLSNMDAFMARLGQVLSQGFAEHTRFDAPDGRTLHAIEVNLEPDVFHLERQGQHVTGTHKKVVRGVALRTHTLTLDVWVEKLLEALAKHADANARAGWVLSQLGGHGGQGRGGQGHR